MKFSFVPIELIKAKYRKILSTGEGRRREGVKQDPIPIENCQDHINKKL